MVNNSRTKGGNVWAIGNTVKVGFLTLRITAVRAVKDSLPDIYSLESLDGFRKYEFIPHNGLTRLWNSALPTLAQEVR